MTMKTINKSRLLIQSILVAFLVILFYSCESLIDVDLPNDRISQEEVFKDINTTKSALNSIYINLRNNPFFSKDVSGINFRMSLFTDELDFVGTSVEYFHQNSIEPNDSEITKWWNNAYQNIYAINLFISKLNQSPSIDDLNKNQLLGEAYTLRALYYQNIVQLYGAIPYTTSTDYKYNTTIGKTSENQVLLKIEEDLLKATELLTYQYRSTDRYYVNKAVAELLLAENYLLQKKDELAEIYSQKVVDNSLYQIESDLSKTFKKTAKSTLWQLSLEQNTTVTPEASLYVFTALGGFTSTISDKLMRFFDDNDLRKTNWITEVKIGNQTYYGVYKYKNKTGNTDENSVFYRVEHAYFILAESLLKQEKNVQSIEIINKIRRKRGLDDLPLNLSKEQIEQNLLQESFKEFFTESVQRFFTLKRWDKLSELTLAKPNWQDRYEQLPIPETQLLLNRNLHPQNIGY